MVKSYDLVCFTESKIDNTDIISFPGYTSFTQPRKQRFCRKSGGISVYSKITFSKYIKQIDTDSDYILWLEIDKKLMNLDENLILGTVYLPPENSNFYSDEEFLTMENEIMSFCSKHKHVMLSGDFNARTSEMRDYTERDDFLADMFNFDEETSEFFFPAGRLQLFNLLSDRKSLDKTSNNHGTKLIDICKNNNLFILNGRFDKDKNIGNFTFRDTSVIDYMLVSVDTLKLLRSFEIVDTDPIFSDGHSILSCTLARTFHFPRPSQKPENKPNPPKWNGKYANNFCTNIEQDQVNVLLNTLTTTSPTKHSINEATEKISLIFHDACAKTFPPPRKKSNYIRPWFGPHCKSARKKYHLARRQYNTHKNSINLSNLNSCSKLYKKTMNKYIAKHKKQTQNKLRQLESKDPKSYWKFINSLKGKTCSNSPSLQEFYNHFKLLNSSSGSENEDINLDPSQNNEILNSRITQEEILRCIQRLNNGKASGLDSILNEHIKCSSHIFLPLYEQLFNTILDTGFFPDQWTTGSIHPIYKNKGDRENVKNYRPITILSCLGKLFTSVLNCRLNEFLEESMILSENQAGFRKQYSCLDHIFSLYALIEILKMKKQKLFCCFIDFSSAFDSVWRVGLWHKLLQSQVNGKVLRVIISMYNEIKSCVSLHGNVSAFFASNSGVRQGENLSPVLFSLYLNDLENYLKHNSSASIVVDCNDEDFFVFMKLGVLLYADDTIIIAQSEQDLQFSLNRFNEYCQTWKLSVNLDKTKVVIFGARKTDHFHFKLGTQAVEITDKYKYLGVYFSQSRSFLNARKHTVEQAKKAMYLLFCRTNNLNLPVDLQLKLFDHTVLPILTYSCEIWGFENIDMLEKVHTDFLRKITKSRKSTPLYMLYAELGRHPIEITIKTRMIGFWNRLLTGKITKLSYLLYRVLAANDCPSVKWTCYIKNILFGIGRAELWYHQNTLNTNSLRYLVKQTLIDQFFQKWRSDLNNSSKGVQFNSFKDTIELETYFKILPQNLYINMVRFRTGNHKMPIETGRWLNIELSNRKCELCDKDTIGDEFHYLLECTFFQRDRERFVPLYYFRRPNMMKFNSLLNNHNEVCLSNLGKFMGIIIKHFR